MIDGANKPTPPRGSSKSFMRSAECKDCRREVERGLRDPDSVKFVYNEGAAAQSKDRGQSPSDRCSEHRRSHQKHVQGMAVAYIDLETAGEAFGSDDEEFGPQGPLGGLGPLPKDHELVEGGTDLGEFGFGMDESHIREMLAYLEDPEQRVLVVKAGTGTGKSTYMPYRLLDPPEGCFRLADLGPIVVTEPRVQATMGVAGFVGEKLSGAGGVGPGYPVGYQVSGDRNHDASCQLVFVTDGTVINWMKEGRLSGIGTIIVDEAHERSTNIDFIMGFLKQNLDRYPHLRVIVTSATFNADFYVEYFQERAGQLRTTSRGLPTVNKVDVPAQKSIGYGFPLFPNLDVLTGDDLAIERCDAEDDVPTAWIKSCPELPLSPHLDDEQFIVEHWKTEYADPFEQEDLTEDLQHEIGTYENLHETTQKLLRLRYQGPIIDSKQWKKQMPDLVGTFVASLVNGLDEEGIFGDVLAFLPTTNSIEEAVEIIKPALGDRADVYALLSSLSTEEKEAALDARRKGSKRKVVISSNLAETSLTVEGVRFVVDSGLICQEEWDPESASGGLPTIPHSQSGIKQRWGRVGRKGPGWVFPLYSKGQYAELPEDTRPGSTRSNLEALVMTAKMGGVDDVVNFPWPAAFVPTTVTLDQTAIDARGVFDKEVRRASVALEETGAVDADGDPTSFGKELSRFQGLGSTSGAIAIMYADRLACVPEVVTILALLDGKQLAGTRGLLMDNEDWPSEWRLEAVDRHRAIYSLCEDDAEAVLQIVASWERSDPEAAPWEDTALRQEFARGLWINHERLLEMAEQRRDVLEALSPAMKEEVKRFVEPGLLKRARGVLSRAMGAVRYVADEQDVFRPTAGEDAEVEAFVTLSTQVKSPPTDVMPLSRRRDNRTGTHELSNLVTFEKWAERDPTSEITGPADAVDLLVAAKVHAPTDGAKDALGAMLLAWPPGTRVQLTFTSSDPSHGGSVLSLLQPAIMPEIEDEADLAEQPEDDDSSIDNLDDGVEDKSWPGPNERIEDNEDVERRMVVDSRPLENDARGCGVCDYCLAGEPSACVEPLISAEQAGLAVDVLKTWSERATRYLDVSDPAFDIVAGDVVNEAWYEVLGYKAQSAASGPAVQIAADWRADGAPYAPGEHRDLAPGDIVELRVGALRRDHRNEVRMLYRTDGLGRFAFREADNRPEKQLEFGQLASGLADREHGIVAALQDRAVVLGTVIPRKEEGCMTVSLLEVLSQHVADNSQRDPRRPYLMACPGEVVEPPNNAGFAKAILELTDSGAGVVHPFSFSVSEGDDTEVAVGSSVFLKINKGTARLPLRDIPLDGPEAIADHYGSAMFVPSQLDELVADDGDRRGGPNHVLLSRGPIPPTAARQLSALHPEDRAWQASVWNFFARSHHLTTDRNSEVEHSGKAGVPRERPLSLTVADDDAERAIAELPVGRTVVGYVVGYEDTAVLVNVRPGITAQVPREACEDREYTVGEQVVALIVETQPRRGVLRLDLKSAFSAEAGVPPANESMTRIRYGRVADETGAAISIQGRPRVITIATVDENRLAVAVEEMAKCLNAVSVYVRVPPERRDAVESKTRTFAKASPGILFANFDRNDDTVLLAVGENPHALGELLALIEATVASQPDTRAQMIVPDGKNGHLIGKQGAIVNDLLARSGCTRAWAIERGPVWTVAGPSVSHIMDFVTLADGVVKGCRLDESSPPLEPATSDIPLEVELLDTVEHEPLESHHDAVVPHTTFVQTNTTPLDFGASPSQDVGASAAASSPTMVRHVPTRVREPGIESLVGPDGLFEVYPLPQHSQLTIDSASETKTWSTSATGSLGDLTDVALPANTPPPLNWWQRRSAGGKLAAAAAVMIPTLAVIGSTFGGTGDEPNANNTMNSAEQTTSASTPLAPSGSLTVVVETITLGAGQGTPVVAGGSIWVPLSPTGADNSNSVKRIDLVTGEVVDTITVGFTPQTPVAAGDSIWVPNALSHSVTRIDLATGEVVDTINVGDSPETPVVAGDSIWVPNIGSDSVTRIDLVTGEVVDTITVASGPSTPVVAGDSIWVPNIGSDSVTRIDMATGEVVDTINVGDSPETPVVAGDSIWVPNALSHSVTRIDLVTGEVVDTINVGDSPLTPVVAGDSIWVTHLFPGSVTRIDLVTGEVVDTINVDNFPGTPAVAGDSIWVPRSTSRSMTRIRVGD